LGWIRLWDGDGTVPYEIYVNSTGYAAGETAGGDTYYAGDAFWIAPGNAPITAGSKYYASNYATETDDANADGTTPAGTATLGYNDARNYAGYTGDAGTIFAPGNYAH